MDLHYKQEVTVGALVLLGAALFIGGTMWLGGRNLFSRGSASVTVQFADVGTLKRGSPVKVSGVNLGNVEEIEYLGAGKVLAKLSLDPKVSPRRDASAELATVGLIADAVVAFNPGSSSEPLPPGTVIIGTVARGLSEIGTELSGQAKEVMSGISQVQFKQISEDLSRTLHSFERLANRYSGSQTAAEVSQTMESLRRVSGRLDSVLAAAQFDKSLRAADSLMANLATLSTNVQSTSRQLDSVLARVRRGEGTLGKLAADTMLYHNAQLAIKAFQEFVDDIRKHPGKIGITLRIF